jgi:hypothetical protein
MAKMYLSEEEAAQALSIDQDALTAMVNEGKLQMYRDGAKNVFKSDDVESVAGASTDSVSLEEVDAAPAAPETMRKEDTVITAQGISIFDDEDLEIEEADPMAKTQIAPSLDDQIALDGVGSGSGLLDLTRESDDTSLGAEVLGAVGASGDSWSEVETIQPDFSSAPAPARASAQYAAEPTEYVEAVDPASGFFGGLMVVGAAIMIMMMIVSIAAMQGLVSGMIEGLQKNLGLFVGIMAVVAIIAGVIGFVMSKNAIMREKALRRLG